MATKSKPPTISAAYINARMNAPPVWHGMPEAARRDIEAAQAAKKAPLLAAFRPALEEAFTAVNGRAGSFTLCASDAIAAAIKAESTMAARGIPKVLRGGTCYTVSSAGPTANAYKYAAAGTSFTLRRDSKGAWALVEVVRTVVQPKQPAREYYTISPAARDALVRQALVGFAVRQESTT